MTAPPTYSEDGEWMWNGDEWIPAPPRRPPKPTKPPVNRKKKARLGKRGRRRNKILNFFAVFAILIVIIAGSRWLFSPDKHTLEYRVAAVSYDDEFRLGWELTKPAERKDMGGLGCLIKLEALCGDFQWTDTCTDVMGCNPKVQFEFEYERAFTALFRVTATGQEDSLPDVCIEILLDGIQIGIECGMSYDPNDGLNYGWIMVSVLINSDLIETLS